MTRVPGAVRLTSSYALNNATLPFGLALSAKGLDAIRSERYLAAGLNVHRGQITNSPAAASLRPPYIPAEKALAA